MYTYIHNYVIKYQHIININSDNCIYFMFTIKRIVPTCSYYD